MPKQLDHDALERAYRAALRFHRRSYVTGVAIGEPMKDGAYQPDECVICVHVREKLPKSALGKHQIFPSSIEGIRLDIVERSFRTRGLSDTERLRRQLLPADPAQPGVQIGVSGGVDGSFGLVVRDRVNDDRCLLSAAHVLDPRCSKEVLQPGPRNQSMPIGTYVRGMLDRQGDAAIARLDRMRPIDPIPFGLHAGITSVRRVRLGEVLVKSGAETGVTRGKVTKTGQFSLWYPDGSLKTMEGFELRPIDEADRSEISDGGDSGSVWYNPDTGEAVGLTVGGDAYGAADPDEWVLACHLDLVFNRLLISLDANDRLT